MINDVDSSHIRLLHGDLLPIEDIEPLRQFTIHDSTTAEVIDGGGLGVGYFRFLNAVGNSEVKCEALDTAGSRHFEVCLVGAEGDGAVGELVETDLAVELT